jgi:hypothetical protein
VLLAAALDLLSRLWPGGRLVRGVGVSGGGPISGARGVTLFPTQSRARSSLLST